MHMCAVEKCTTQVMHDVRTSTTKWIVLVCSPHLDGVVRLIQLRYKGKVTVTSLLPEWCSTEVLKECDRVTARARHTLAG